MVFITITIYIANLPFFGVFSISSTGKAQIKQTGLKRELVLKYKRDVKNPEIYSY